MLALVLAVSWAGKPVLSTGDVARHPPGDLGSLSSDPLRALVALGGGETGSVRIDHVAMTDVADGRASVRLVVGGQAPGALPMHLRAPRVLRVQRSTGRVEGLEGEDEIHLDPSALGPLGDVVPGPTAPIGLNLAFDLTATWGVAPVSRSDASRALRGGRSRARRGGGTRSRSGHGRRLGGR